MKLQTLLILGFVLGVTGCAEKEQAAPAQADEPTPPPAAAEGAGAEEPMVEETSADESMATVEVTARGADFLDHMHAHAEMLDDISYALSDGDLEAAATPAYWLTSHDTVEGVPEEWLPFVDGMRAAASEIEGAADIEAARAAAARINENCQACHAAAGIVLE